MGAEEMDQVGEDWASADSVSLAREEETGGSAGAGPGGRERGERGHASPSSRGGGRSKAGTKPRARPGARGRGAVDAVSRCEAGGSYGERLSAFRAALRRVARRVWDVSGVGGPGSGSGSGPRAGTSDKWKDGGEDD